MWKINKISKLQVYLKANWFTYFRVWPITAAIPSSLLGALADDSRCRGSRSSLLPPGAATPFVFADASFIWRRCHAVQLQHFVQVTTIIFSMNVASQNVVCSDSIAIKPTMHKTINCDGFFKTPYFNFLLIVCVLILTHLHVVNWCICKQQSGHSLLHLQNKLSSRLFSCLGLLVCVYLCEGTGFS